MFWMTLIPPTMMMMISKMFSECRLVFHLSLLLPALGVASVAQERNLSSEGTASQSSEWDGGQFPARNAIDGDTGTFSHTDSNTRDNHWLLAFEDERALQRIELVAREDCCAGRLTGAVLRVLDDDGESVFDAEVVDPGQGNAANYELPAGTFGKSIRVGFENGDTNSQGNRNLHLAELRVFGDDSTPLSIDVFEAEETHIASGESVVLSWATTGAVSVEIPGVGAFAATGQTTVSPTGSTEFALVATAENGATTTTALLTVLVDGVLLPAMITEFMAAPAADAADWIEIHNPNPEAVVLDGFSLTDASAHSGRWTFPSATHIAPNGFLTVLAAGASGNEGALEASFRLAREADSYLALLAPDGVPVSEYVYPRQWDGIAFGSDASGGRRYFLTPTPGAVNGNGFDGFVADTQFNVDRGYYAEPFDLEITSTTEGATILVTLDGSLPEPGNAAGFVYDAPMGITGTSVVRAAAYRVGFLPTNIDTQTYVFVADVLQQPELPEGFPESWGDGPGLHGRLPAKSDYAMDPRIVDDAPFLDLDDAAFGWNEAFRSIPSMSLVLPIGDLLDPEDGLHAQAGNRGRAWEREASLEIIDPARESAVQANCGLRMQGGWNRGAEMLKKSMRLYFRGEYGDGKLRYPLFDDTEVVEFDRLVLRSGNGKAWPSPWRALSGGGNSLPRTTYLRDQFVRDTQRDLGHPIAHGNFVHLYVNGLYWGLYNTTERLDEKYASAHLGGDEEDYDIVKWIRGLGGLQLVAGKHGCMGRADATCTPVHV